MDSPVESLRQLLHIDPYRNLSSARTWERLKKGLNPEYVTAKLALILYEVRHPDHPWITKEAITLLEGFLHGNGAGFEWGSGNGSIWLARRSRSLVSVEHHAAWHARVKKQLARGLVTNVDYRLVTEQAYPDVIDSFPEGHFDYILIDGLVRDTAFVKSIPRLRSGGWIIFDNINWFMRSSSATPHSLPLDGPAYSPLMQQVEEQVAGWTTRWTTNGVNDTAVFVKP